MWGGVGGLDGRIFDLFLSPGFWFGKKCKSTTLAWGREDAVVACMRPCIDKAPKTTSRTFHALHVGLLLLKLAFAV